MDEFLDVLLLSIVARCTTDGKPLQSASRLASGRATRENRGVSDARSCKDANQADHRSVTALKLDSVGWWPQFRLLPHLQATSEGTSSSECEYYQCRLLTDRAAIALDTIAAEQRGPDVSTSSPPDHAQPHER